MSTAVYDTLILSDLHLGSDISRAEEATRMLRQNVFRRLILLGDIFSDLNFRRLTKEHWKFLSYIRKLSNPKREVEVVWVEGNHDQGLSNVMSHLVGVKVYEEYIWEFDGRRHLAIHGHQFDRFVVNNWLLSNLNTFLHLQLQKLDAGSKRISRYVDRLDTRWLRLSTKVAPGALVSGRASARHSGFSAGTRTSHCPGNGTASNTTMPEAGPTRANIRHRGCRGSAHSHVSESREAALDSNEEDSLLAELADDSEFSENAEYEGVGMRYAGRVFHSHAGAGHAHFQK